MGVTMMTKDAGVPTETKDFGSVGCATETWTKDLLTHRPLAKPNYKTTCFAVQGGFLSLVMESDNSSQVSYDSVKGILEKAAQRRR
jgi:hypothetical protein